MIERVAADLILLVHFSFILFVVLGGFLVFKWGNVGYFHIPCALWSVLITFGGWICPLTPLENHFRRLAGEAGYAGGFVDHYVTPLIYPSGLTHGVQGFTGALLLVLNLCIYWRAWVNRKRRRKDRGR